MENQLEVIVQSSGLEETKANFILEKFQDYFKLAAEWEAKAKTIVVTDESQKADMQIARVGRLFLREKRIAVEKSRKELKEQALREGKAIDGIANVLKALIVPIEEYLEKQERFVELRDEAIARAEAEKKAAAEEAERIAREKAEAEERERIRLENERLKAEVAERERIAAEERERAAKVLREQQEKAAAAQRAAKIAADKQAAVLAEQKKKADEKIRAEQQKARLEREAAERKLAEVEAEKVRLEKMAASRKTITCPKCGEVIELR